MPIVVYMKFWGKKIVKNNQNGSQLALLMNITEHNVLISVKSTVNNRDALIQNLSSDTNSRLFGVPILILKITLIFNNSLNVIIHITTIHN